MVNMECQQVWNLNQIRVLCHQLQMVILHKTLMNRLMKIMVNLKWKSLNNNAETSWYSNSRNNQDLINLTEIKT